MSHSHQTGNAGGNYSATPKRDVTNHRAKRHGGQQRDNQEDCSGKVARFDSRAGKDQHRRFLRGAMCVDLTLPRHVVG